MIIRHIIQKGEKTILLHSPFTHKSQIYVTVITELIHTECNTFVLKDKLHTHPLLRKFSIQRIAKCIARAYRREMST
jgi:hypothetical protein